MSSHFDLERARASLARTPAVLQAWLADLSIEWTQVNEGPDTWSAYDVVGHLIHGERTDWIPRAKHILAGNADVPFQPFDRLAQFHESRGKTLEELLDTFERLRRENLTILDGLRLTEEELNLRGSHPDLGNVTLRQLLATWVVHDLTHLTQIARVLAFQLKEDVGPWRQYLRVLGAQDNPRPPHLPRE